MTDLSAVTANLWSSNPLPEQDIHTLVSRGLSCIGLNESSQYIDTITDIAQAHGFRAYGLDSNHPAESILLPSRFREVVIEQRQTAQRAGGSQIERWGIAARFVVDNVQYALLVVHLNTNAQNSQNWSDPADIPDDELESYRRSVKVCADWANELRGRGCRTIVTGDFNWAYSTPMRDAWKWSPQKAFRRRAGMLCQYHYEMIPRPDGDRRSVEYIFWHADDFDYLGQSFVVPEYSDHPYHRVDLRATS